jgi:glycosyltransferase involved in cell wall biosynthesis
MTLRVTLATYDDDPPVGGQGVLVRGMRPALLRRGVDVRTVAGRGPNGIPFPRRTRRAMLDLSLRMSREPQLLLEGGCELIHAMGGPGGIVLMRPFPVPVVYTANHTYAQAYRRTDPRRALTLVEARAYRRAAAVMCISPSTADVVRRHGIDAKRVEVVLPGVEADRIGAAAAGITREAGRLLFVGRLEAAKRPLDAVAGMAALCARDPAVHGVVIGEGSLMPRVRAAAAAVGDSRITILGAVGDEELAREYARASLVLVPSAYEGLGLVALEAQVAGATVCGYDVTGLRDAVGEGGIVTPPGDVGALAEAAWGLLRDEPRRAEMAARGREAVLRDHSWDVAAQRIVEVYQMALTGR